MKAVLSKNETIIASDVYKADNIIKRTLGLLGKKTLENSKGLLIVPCNSIHSIGMQFDFDAVFICKNQKVVYLIEKMKPFKVSPIIFKAIKVLELPEGTIEKFSIKVDDIIEFKD
ncbi:MAG: DUF192 domain-containing protein [bacterium]